MKRGEIVVGQTYCNWSVQFSKWWYRTVVSIQPDEWERSHLNVTFTQHYGDRGQDGRWRQETTRLTSFARWAQGKADLPEEVRE